MRKVVFISVLLVILLSNTALGAEFTYKNISYSKESYGAKFIGEITNNSGKGFKLANFVMSIYSGDNTLIDVVYINISSFPNGQTKSFSTISIKNLPKNIKYQIQFENGF